MVVVSRSLSVQRGLVPCLVQLLVLVERQFLLVADPPTKVWRFVRIFGADLCDWLRNSLVGCE